MYHIRVNRPQVRAVTVLDEREKRAALSTISGVLVCDICSAGYTEHNGLERHARRGHGETLALVSLAHHLVTCAGNPHLIYTKVFSGLHRDHSAPAMCMGRLPTCRARPRPAASTTVAANVLRGEPWRPLGGGGLWKLGDYTRNSPPLGWSSLA